MRYSFPPLAAFLGGVVSQEIIKAITQKFTPIQQFFYYDLSELYQEKDVPSLPIESKRKLIEEGSMSDRYLGLKMCLGTELF